MRVDPEYRSTVLFPSASCTRCCTALAARWSTPWLSMSSTFGSRHDFAKRLPCKCFERVESRSMRLAILWWCRTPARRTKVGILPVPAHHRLQALWIRVLRAMCWFLKRNLSHSCEDKYFVEIGGKKWSDKHIFLNRAAKSKSGSSRCNTVKFRTVGCIVWRQRLKLDKVVQSLPRPRKIELTLN